MNMLDEMATELWHEETTFEHQKVTNQGIALALVEQTHPRPPAPTPINPVLSHLAAAIFVSGFIASAMYVAWMIAMVGYFLFTWALPGDAIWLPGWKQPVGALGILLAWAGVWAGLSNRDDVADSPASAQYRREADHLAAVKTWQGELPTWHPEYRRNYDRYGDRYGWGRDEDGYIICSNPECSCRTPGGFGAE